MTLRPRQPDRRPTIRPTTRRGPGASPGRRSRAVRRASAGLSPVRAGAILVMLMCAAAVYGVANSTVFEARTIAVEGTVLTDAAAISAAVEDVRGQNLFTLLTRPLEDRVRRIPTVRGVVVSVRLPETLVVRIRERTAILVWQLGARRYLVDADGRLFAIVPDSASPSVAALPVIDDRRAGSVGLAVGLQIDPVDLDAATRLGSLAPADVGSQAQGLAVSISDVNGFTVRSRPASWQAVFGFYTPTLRTPALVPGQVRLLRSLLIGREPLVDRIILASETDGTFTTKPSPSPSASPAP
ncbi:MAG TPA: FtsQ-type POTRA domain-containing protein [Candidatus Limnocylindrales bacterium]|nr:FtsQ-type POTRA domain-containing protein [Candidatus Limnocylindrales bacterium]